MVRLADKPGGKKDGFYRPAKTGLSCSELSNEMNEY